MSTRSTKLGSIKPAAAVETILFTVPVGYTYIVKDVVALNGGGGTDLVAAYAKDAGGLRGVCFYNTTIAAFAIARFAGWLVLNPGEQFAVYAGSGRSEFWVSGTSLVGSV